LKRLGRDRYGNKDFFRAGSCTTLKIGNVLREKMRIDVGASTLQKIVRKKFASRDRGRSRHAERFERWFVLRLLCYLEGARF